MRWLPRWRRAKARDARPGPELTSAQAPGRTEHWRRLRPLAPTVRRAPLTAAGSIGVLAGYRSQPLIPAPGRRRRGAGRGAAGGAPVVEPVSGWMAGLVTVRTESPSEPSSPAPAPGRAAPAEQDPAGAALPAAPLLTPRVLATAGPRPSLVRAVDEYVGNPEPEAAPSAASAWLRMVESYRPPWAGEPGAEAPELPFALPPLSAGGGSWSSEAAVAPPRTSGQTPAEAPRTVRRATLAESRRLGLGQPLRRTGEPPADEPGGEDGQSAGLEAAVADSAPERMPEPRPEFIPEPEPRTGSDNDADRNDGDDVVRPHGPGLAAPVDPPEADASEESILETARPANPGPVHAVRPVYRFVPGERRAQESRTAARPATPAFALMTIVTEPTATTASSPADRPLTHPPSRSRPDVARHEAEPQPPVPAPVPAPVPPPVQAPPFELADAVRRTHGVDVSDVPIHRGPEVAAEARALGARAFTRGGEVFLPADEGPLDQPVARGLLAHELTHAAQQRALGSALPPEDSDPGAALEAAAVATERWARGLGGAPPTGGAIPVASWTAPWNSAPAGGVQRQVGDVASVAGPAPAPAMPATVTGGPPPSMGTAERAVTLASPDGTPPTSEVPRVTAAQTVPFGQGPTAADDKPGELTGRRPLDLDDPGDIEELAVRIYQKIHGRLRRELLVDRERAGRLGETGPFGWAR